MIWGELNVCVRIEKGNRTRPGSFRRRDSRFPDEQRRFKEDALEVYRVHVQQVTELVGKECSLGSLKRFRAAFTSLGAYIEHKKIDDIKLWELNRQFITGYEYF